MHSFMTKIQDHDLAYLLATIQQEFLRILHENKFAHWMYDFFKTKQETMYPLLILLTGNISGASRDSLIRVATTIEILHTATLVHRKISDHFPPLKNSYLKNQTIILAGDYLYAQSLALAAQESVQVVRGIAELMQSLVVSDLLLQKQPIDVQSKPDQVLEHIQYESANFAAICCRLGAQMGNAPTAMVDSLYAYGFSLGMASHLHAHIRKPIEHDSVVTSPHPPLLVNQYVQKAKQSLAEIPHCTAKDLLFLLANKTLSDPFA